MPKFHVVVEGDDYDQGIAAELMDALRVYAQLRASGGRPWFELRLTLTPDSLVVATDTTTRRERKYARPRQESYNL